MRPPIQGQEPPFQGQEPLIQGKGPLIRSRDPQFRPRDLSIWDFGGGGDVRTYVRTYVRTEICPLFNRASAPPGPLPKKGRVRVARVGLGLG